MKNSEGKKVPEVTFKTRRGHEWVDVRSSDLFKGRTVVVFALPGAYTPTCSSTHVPGYNRLAGEFKKCGVDEIICLSVNDAFVMNAWKSDQHADNVTFLPDGNAEFTEAMGMLSDKKGLGFGGRSWRYSMLVRDGGIEKMFIEPEREGDPFDVSDAETMLRYLNPEAVRSPSVALFTKDGCPYCARTKRLLDEKGIGYDEVVLGKNGVSMETVRAVTGRTSVPQVFWDGKLIGSSEELAAYLEAAEPAIKS